jgi:hypothetical protein
MHPYTTEFLAHDHIATLRAEAERDRQGLEDAPRRPPTRGGLSRLVAHVLAVGQRRGPGRLTVQPTD